MPCPRLNTSYYQKPIFRVIRGGIKINTDKRLFEGKVASTYTPDWRNIKDSSYGGISDKGGVAKNDTIKLPTNINNVEDIKINEDDFVITTINEDGTKTETKIPIKDLVPEKDKTNLEQSLTETTQTTTIKDELGNTFVYSQNPDGTKSITKTSDTANVIGTQIAKCLFGAGLDFGFYYTAQWVGAYLDDKTFPNNKPSFNDFSVVTNYKDWSWAEAVVSAGTSCLAANLPSFLAPEISKKIAIGLGALGGAAEGFSTEMAKQYEFALKRLKTGKSKQNPNLKPNLNPSLIEVVKELDWQPIIVNSASSGIVTGGITWIASSSKLGIVASKIKKRFKINDLAKEKDQVIDYFTKNFGKEASEKVDDGVKKLGTLIDDKIKILPKEKLYGAQASTFLNILITNKNPKSQV